MDDKPKPAPRPVPALPHTSPVRRVHESANEALQQSLNLRW